VQPKGKKFEWNGIRFDHPHIHALRILPNTINIEFREIIVYWERKHIKKLQLALETKENRPQKCR